MIWTMDSRLDAKRAALRRVPAQRAFFGWSAHFPNTRMGSSCRKGRSDVFPLDAAAIFPK